MTSTQESRWTVFRAIAEVSYLTWPSYDDTRLYDRSSLGAIESDVRTVARVWFEHDAHESVDEFVAHLPLEHVNFVPHDQYTGATIYEMDQLFQLFVIARLHGIESETALVEYLEDTPALVDEVKFETIPNQSTLWRTWNERFTADLRETIERCARLILIQADRSGVETPREPPELDLMEDDDPDEESLDDRTILNQANEITEQVSRTVYPAFSLDRGEGCEIHENAFWELQTYLGLRSNLAANEGARSFLFDSTRDRTPLGHNHRAHIRDLSVEEIRDMYQDAIGNLIDHLPIEDLGYRHGIVAIDITEDDPFTGDRTGRENEILGTKESSDEYAYQWATIQHVAYRTPLVLDARPVRKGESRREIVEDLLDSAQELIGVRRVLMDREFDSQQILEMIDQRGLEYIVPKRKRNSERAQAKRLLNRGQDRFVTDRKLHLGKNEWHETRLIYKRNEESDRDGFGQYAVFMTNAGISSAIVEYGFRWEIETGYRSIKRFMAATTSKSFSLRFFYFAFACLLYSIWRTIDYLLQLELTDEYDRSPMITAQNTLTLLRKQTGIG